MEEDSISARRRQRAAERAATEDGEATIVTPAPEPDPRLVSVQEATAKLIAACEQLPATEARGHAIAHARSVPIYAAQAVREG